MSDSPIPNASRILSDFKTWLFNNGAVAQFTDDEYLDFIADMLTTDTATGDGFLATFMRQAGYVSDRVVSPTPGPEQVAIDEVAQRTYATLVEGQAAILASTVDMAAIALEHEGPKWDKEVAPGEPPQENPLIIKMIDMKLLTEETAAWLVEIVNSTGLKGGLLMGAVIIGIALRAIGNIGDIAGGEFYKNALTKFTPNVPSASELLKPFLVDKENRENILHGMRENGLSDDDIGMLLKNNEFVFDPNDIRELLWRKIITDEQADTELERTGLSPDRIAFLRESWNIIPSPQDILWMVSKEAFEPDQVAVFGLGDEFPEDQVHWLEKKGLTRFWQEHYWFAHWDPPSLQMGFEMLHRGVLTGDELDALFRVHEIPPFFRPKLKAISYRPLTRVDVRRMYRAGSVTLETVKRTYLDLGYDDANADMLTDWTAVEYAQETRDLTRSQIERAYADGVIPENEAIALLIQIGFSSDQAQWTTNNVELQEVKRLQDKVVKVIEKQFVNGIITEIQARTSLAEQEVSSARIEVHILDWGLEKELDVKLPSKTDLSKFIKHSLITEAQYLEFMSQLGYAPALANTYLQLDRIT